MPPKPDPSTSCGVAAAIIGKVWIPNDNGQALIDAIRSDARVYGVSDGSASKGAASHGRKIA